MFDHAMRILALMMGLVLASNASAQVIKPMVSMGSDHALALRADGTVLAWGSDTYGQLGLGRPLIATVPQKVAGLSNVVAIAGGSIHSLAVRLDGTVWAWGGNGSGQLGDGTSLDRSTPFQVPGVTQVVMACGGSSHTAALRHDGTIWTWGTNTSGQLGNGIAGGEWWRTAPGPVTGLTGATALACAGEQTFALLQDGTVRAWGLNSHGELGDGTTTNRPLPVQVSGLADVIAINGMAALKRDGTVWEWGWTNGVAVPTPRQSAGVASAVALSSSFTTIYGTTLAAIKSDGMTWWNWTLGETPLIQNSVGPIKALATPAFFHILLKADGTVVARGLNNSGQLGNGITPTQAWNWQGDFLPVVGLANIRALATGETHALALDANGDVWAWGNDVHGEIGRGGMLAPTVPAVVAGLSNIVQVAAGWKSSLAVDASGNVWAWGINSAGQLGDGSDINRSAPFRVTAIQNVQAVAAAAGEYFPTTLALKRDGTVWAWGHNGDGQLGNGTTGGTSHVPTQVPGLTQVTSVSAYWHMLAVRQDGTVWAWGTNSNGQLGLGTTTSSAVPVQISGLSGVSTVTAAAARSFAVKTDGTAMAWGSGSWGALGDGTWSDFNQLTPKPVPGLTNTIEIVRGTSHALARRSDGSVWAWGMQSDSRIGGIPWNMPPAPIPNLAPMLGVSAGGVSSALLGVDGLLYMGGLNTAGELGDGTFAQHPDFVLAINPGVTGFLDLMPGTPKNILPRFVPPFLVKTEKLGSLNSLTLRTDVRGLFGTTAQALSAKAQSASEYKLYVAALAGSNNILNWFQLNANRNWSALEWPMAQFLSNVSLSSRLDSVLVEILDGVDVSSLIGSHIYVGYGTDADEMLRANRYREVMTVAAPQ